MNTTFTTLVAAITLAAGGIAAAQSTPPTSTAGSGCTATANAIRGGNLGGTATNKECGNTPMANTATSPTTTGTPSTMTTSTPAPAPMAAPMAMSPDTSTSGATMAKAPTRMRVARADRN